jgi:hypothetical protein
MTHENDPLLVEDGIVRTGVAAPFDQGLSFSDGLRWVLRGMSKS